MDDVGKLVLFRDVVELGGFSRAASARGLSHSTVSKHIKSLETMLGVTLLHRTSRVMTLSEEGRVVLEYSRRVGAEVRALTEHLASMRGEVRGELRVNSLRHVGRHVVQPAMTAFLKAYPRARVWLTLDDGPLNFSRDGFDLAVRVGLAAEAHLMARKLMDNPVCWVASPHFLERVGMPDHPADLAHVPTVAYAAGGLEITTWAYEEAGTVHAVEVMPVCRVNDGNALLEAVSEGLGVGYVSRFAAQEALEEGVLVELFPERVLPPYAPIYMIYARTEHTPPKLDAFMRCLEEVVSRGGAPNAT